MDFQKASDRVKHKMMIDIQESIRIDGKDRRIIKNLYWQQSESIKIGHRNTEGIVKFKGSDNVVSPLPQSCLIYTPKKYLKKYRTDLKEMLR